MKHVRLALGQSGVGGRFPRRRRRRRRHRRRHRRRRCRRRLRRCRHILVIAAVAVRFVVAVLATADCLSRAIDLALVYSCTCQ